jgi:hypothetical protein
MGVFDSIFGGGQADEAKRAARQAKRAEVERQARIERGRQDIRRIFGEQFTPDFYTGIERDYTNMQMPLLNRQSDEATRSLLYALARAGLSRGSAAAKGKADLQTDTDLARQRIAKGAADMANQRRGQVENSRQAVESQLYATADPAAAAEASRNTALNLSFTPEYSPIGQLLTDVSGWYGMQGQEPGAQTAAKWGANVGGGRSSSGYGVK